MDLAPKYVSQAYTCNGRGETVGLLSPIIAIQTKNTPKHPHSGPPLYLNRELAPEQNVITYEFCLTLKLHTISI